MSSLYRLVLSLEINERKSCMFPDVCDEFFSQVTAGFGCRLCVCKGMLSINSGALKYEVVVKVCAMNAHVCMCISWS
jgi:hypothetical protein